jgi:hypothetical protein
VLRGGQALRTDLKVATIVVHARQVMVIHPVQLDVGMLWGCQAQGVDLNVAERPRPARVCLGAHLAHHLVQRRGLARARHACYIQALPQALIACASGKQSEVYR